MKTVNHATSQVYECKKDSIGSGQYYTVHVHVHVHVQYMYMYRYGMHDDYICINPELQNPDPMSCIPVACDSL